MSVKGVEVIIRNKQQIIRFNSPNTKNALSLEVYTAVATALNSSAQDDQVICTILTGAGDYFSSGTSLSLNLQNTDTAYDKIAENSVEILRNFVSALIDYPKLLIAVVNGPALGIAVTVLGLCDVVFASDKATFQTPFMRLGLCPEACSSYTFPRIMGPAKAGQMIYLGYKMTAMEACECGLVSNVFQHSKLNDIILSLQKISELPNSSLLCSKSLIRNWDKEALHKANIAENIQLLERFKSDDFLMAVINFSKKRNKL